MDRLSVYAIPVEDPPSRRERAARLERRPLKAIPKNRSDHALFGSFVGGPLPRKVDNATSRLAVQAIRSR
jgi:hypothetical protein